MTRQFLKRMFALFNKIIREASLGRWISLKEMREEVKPLEEGECTLRRRDKQSWPPQEGRPSD